MLGLVADHANRNPTAVALLAPGRPPLTYARLYAEIHEHARTLRAIGLSKEDRIALLLPNGPEAALSFLATSMIAACAPLNCAYTANELDAALSQLKPKVLIAWPDLNGERRDVAAKHGVRVITATPALEREAGVFELSASATLGEVNSVLPEPNDIALLLQTSGTTSKPKLVGLTHEHLRRSAENIARSLKLNSEDRCLNVMPLFHIHGIVAAILSSVYAGASAVCTPGFRGRDFFQWLQEFRPSWYTAVPTIHAAVVARSDRHGDILKHHSLRFIRSCSAALPALVLRNLEQRFGVPVLEAYGMTEAAHQIASNPMPPGIRKIGSVGVPAGTEIAIFDELGRPLEPDCEGEIVIRGGNVISCYVGDPSINQQSFSGSWFRTGDVGSIDLDGYLFIRGRAKELINCGGMKFSPHEIEEVLLNHPNVAEAVVFGIPESRLGEVVAAAVVLRHPGSTMATEIREFAPHQLNYFKVPRQVIILSEIPRSPTGKPQRVGLADTLRLTALREEHRENVPIKSQTQLEQVLATMWAQIIGIERISPHDKFFEIGGDSLTAVELMAGIEQVTGRRLTVSALFQAPTIKQLAAFIEEYDPGRQQYVVPIQTRGSEPPFFCVDGGPRYLNLAQRLGTDRPFLGLLCPDAIATSIEAMAKFNVKSIRAVQPEGPYFIAGWCTRGLVAYEIAQQLRAQGQEVALLVLFDAINPTRLDGLSFMRKGIVQADELCRKVWLHLLSMSRLDFDDIPAYLLERLKAAWHALTRRAWPTRVTVELLRPVLRRQPSDNMHLIGRRYRPKPYAGRVVLVRRSLRAISRYLDRKLGWDGVIVGEFDVVEIQGGHSDMFDEPEVQSTAATLAAYLQDHPRNKRLT